jgi:transposase
MEACSGAHHWARLFSAQGQTATRHAIRAGEVRGAAVAADGGGTVPHEWQARQERRADAAAICEAVQQVHRARQGFVVERSGTISRISGLLAEFGIVLPQKAEVVRRAAAHHLEELPG